jgi:undecaprenyl-diphosphatase
MDFLEPIDLGTRYFFETHRQPWLNGIVVGLTHLGDDTVLWAVTGLAALALLLTKRWRTALCVVLAVALAFGLTEPVKRIVKRPRPQIPSEIQLVPTPGSPSFPSGHALRSMAVFGALGFTLARRAQRWTVATILIAVGLLLPVLIGATRLYLCVHYLTDVIGGWTAGLACALLALWVDQRLQTRQAATG